MFGPVWTALYAGMGYASYLVYRDGGGLSGAAKMPLALYASQLALNWAWTPLFFGKHDLRSSFYEICALWLNIAACGLSFYAVNRTAGFQFLLILYVLLPGYGGTLNNTGVQVFSYFCLQLVEKWFSQSLQYNTRYQCSGSVTFMYESGSGSLDPFS